MTFAVMAAPPHVGDQLAHKLVQFGFVHGLSSAKDADV
jgi:hypothetical protein